MSHPFALFSSVLALSIVFTACAEPAPPADLAISNVTVIDAVNGVREGQTVVVAEGRIASVSPIANHRKGPVHCHKGSPRNAKVMATGGASKMTATRLKPSL